MANLFRSEGSKTLFRIALTILKHAEPQIRNFTDNMEIMTTIQGVPRKFQDAAGLMETCYKRRNGFGHLSQETVDERRRIRRAFFAQERANARRDPRASKDDFAMLSPIDSRRFDFPRGPRDHHNRFGAHHGTRVDASAELLGAGRRFKKMLVKA